MLIVKHPGVTQCDAGFGCAIQYGSVAATFQQSRAVLAGITDIDMASERVLLPAQLVQRPNTVVQSLTWKSHCSVLMAF